MAELSGIADPAALLAGLFAHVPVGFQIYTADGYSVLTNPKFREIFGGSRRPATTHCATSRPPSSASSTSSGAPSPARR